MYFQYNVKKADVSRHDKHYGNYGNYPFIQVDMEFQIKQKFDHDGKLKTAWATVLNLSLENKWVIECLIFTLVF